MSNVTIPDLRAPEILAPGEWDASITYGYDSDQDFLAADIRGVAINIGPLTRAMLDREAAIGIIEALAPKDAIPGVINIYHKDSTTFLPEKPRIQDDPDMPRYATDPRDIATEQYRSSVIQRRTTVIVPSDIVGYSTYRMGWQANHIQRELVEGLVLGTKLRSEQAMREALDYVDRSRAHARLGAQIGLIANAGVAAHLSANGQHLPATGESLALTGIGVALISVLHQTIQEARKIKSTKITSEILVHAQNYLCKQARQEVKRYFDDTIPTVAELSSAKNKKNTQTTEAIT